MWRRRNGLDGGGGDGDGIPLEGGGRCFGNPDSSDKDDGGTRSGTAASKGGGNQSSRDKGEGRGQVRWQGEGLKVKGKERETREDEEEEEFYNGELLVLAERLGRRLLPAFETPTGVSRAIVALVAGALSC